MSEMDLFSWADSRPTGKVIEASHRFEARTETIIFAMIAGRQPPEREGRVIRPDFNRKREDTAA